MSAVLKRDATAASAPRYNIYQVIHKALRAFMCDTQLRIGRMDANDDGERSGAAAQLRALLALCDSHLRHENEFVHAAIERRAPGGAARTQADHAHHEASIAALRDELARFESAPAFERARLGQALYLDLSAFVAENLQHMITEETDNHAALTAAYDEGEVLAIEQALVASLAPEEKFTAMSWMIPNINASERALLLGGIKRHAPREAFDAVFGLARDTLSQRDLYKLERALG
jgi:hypothetical protein